jgi:hypothetical protein
MEFILPVVLALITSILGPIIVEWVRKKLNKTQTTDPLAEAIAHNQEVDHQLQLIMDETDASRIWIAQFHNGGHFYPTGKSIQKFSIFYEKVAPAISSIMELFQNIPVSLFPKALGQLYRDRELVILDCGNDENFDLPSIPGERGSQSFYMLTIHDADDRFIGVLAVSFTEKERKLTKDEWIFIRSKTGAIGMLLANYLKNVKKP